jgi:uncharacterized protein YqeY
MLIERLRTDLNAATKQRDSVRQRTIRSVIAAVQEAQVAGDESVILDDDGVQAVIRSQVKRRLDAAEAFTAGGRSDRAADEQAEIGILETYLPAALDADELQSIVANVLSTHGFASKADMGAAMKAVNAVIDGRADGRVVADLVKARLA